MSSVDKEVIEVDGKRFEIVVYFYECQGLFEARYEEEDCIGVGTTREKAIENLIEDMKEAGVL